MIKVSARGGYLLVAGLGESRVKSWIEDEIMLHPGGKRYIIFKSSQLFEITYFLLLSICMGCSSVEFDIRKGK